MCTPTIVSAHEPATPGCLDHGRTSSRRVRASAEMVVKLRNNAQLVPNDGKPLVARQSRQLSGPNL